MLITEIKKEIMDLIDPYMDKTLSEGCYCLLSDKYRMPQKLVFIWEEDENGFHYMRFTHWWEWKENVDDYRIFWHYDITAVLGYIDSKEVVVFDVWSEGFVEVYRLDDEWWRETIWKISNKPLYLYTEEEELNLLELLQKLCQK